MKKILLIGLITAFVLSFASVSFAEEIDRVVGDDIEVEEGEFKIVSIPENDGDRPVSDDGEQAPDVIVGEDIDIEEGEFKIISIDEDSDVVGDDIDIEEGEFKIISIDEDSDVVGDDIEIGDDEVKIISVDEEIDQIVGDDIEIGEDEAKIISVDENDNEDEQSKNKWPVVAGISAAVLVAAGIVVLIKKVLWP